MASGETSLRGESATFAESGAVRGAFRVLLLCLLASRLAFSQVGGGTPRETARPLVAFANRLYQGRQSWSNTPLVRVKTTAGGWLEGVILGSQGETLRLVRLVREQAGARLDTVRLGLDEVAGLTLQRTGGTGAAIGVAALGLAGALLYSSLVYRGPEDALGRVLAFYNYGLPSAITVGAVTGILGLDFQVPWRCRSLADRARLASLIARGEYPPSWRVRGAVWFGVSRNGGSFPDGAAWGGSVRFYRSPQGAITLDVERWGSTGTENRWYFHDVRRTCGFIRIGCLRLVGDPCSRVGVALGWSAGYLREKNECTVSGPTFDSRYTDVDHYGSASAELHLILRAQRSGSVWIGVRRVMLGGWRWNTVLQVAMEWGEAF